MGCSVDGCTNKPWRHELCQRHYRELSKDGRFSWPAPEQRFWNKVDQRGPDECWPWTGAINGHGYGSFKQGTTHSAHRFAYELQVGPVPDGMELDHVCHTNDTTCHGGATCLHRRCVNPAHLEPVAPLTNWQRGRSPHANAARQTHCVNGHEFTPENTAYYPSRPNNRVCLICHRAAGRETMRRVPREKWAAYMREYRARKRV